MTTENTIDLSGQASDGDIIVTTTDGEMFAMTPPRQKSPIDLSYSSPPNASEDVWSLTRTIKCDFGSGKNYFP
jgi:hypothetical protein